MEFVQQCKHGIPIGAPYHDCAYVDFRASLVPAAERYANERAGPRPATKSFAVGRAGQNPQYDEWTKLWNILFHGFIDNAVQTRYGGSAR